MNKRKERTIQDISDATPTLSLPQVTPVLGGNFRMEGPVGNSICDLLNHMVKSENSKGEDSCSDRSQKFDYREKSGTCNVCSAPCTSCFHVNKVLMKSNDESAGENCAENMVVDDGKQCEIGQPSEQSTVACLNSTSDSFSENAIGKASSKTSNESASDDNVVHSKSEFQRVPEGHDDCLSCASGTDKLGNRKFDTDSRIRYDRQRKICLESSDKVPPCGSPGGLYSQKSDSVEIPLSMNTNDATELLKNKNTSQASCEKYMQRDPDSRNVSDDRPSDANDTLLESSAERLESVPRGVSSDVICGDPPAMALNSSEKNDNMEVEIHTMDETDDSDIVEQDVKVCDICGDEGRDDLLAICCKCSDGAEHTYCMREMLDKVPEGEWTCEECRIIERESNERDGKIGRMDENEKINSSGQASSENINSSDAEGHRTKGYKKLPGKRLRDDADAEVSSIAKKPAIDSVVASPKTSNSGKTAAISQKSFKNQDKGRLQSSQHSISDAVPVNDTTESASSASDLRGQKYRGIFSKSNSFNSLNSKPKTKLVDQVIIQRQKSAREHGSFRIEGVARSIGKSLSFKSTSSHAESKMKMLSPRLAHNQDIKVTGNAKQRSSFEQQRRTERPSNNSMMSTSMTSTSRIDKRPASRPESSSFTTVTNHHELKPVRTDGKSASLSRSSSLAARRNADLSNSLGRRPSIYSHSTVGVSSADGVNNAEQKSNQTNLKEDFSSCSVVAERPTSNANESLPADLPRPRDLTYSGSRFSLTSVKSSRDDSDNIKAAIEAAVLRKPGVYRRNRACFQSDEPSVSSVGCEVASYQDRISNSSGKNKSSSGAELPERSRNLTADSIKQETVNNVKIPLEGHSSGEGESTHFAPTSRDMFCDVSAAVPFLLKSLAIPEHEYIWQGSFEICRSGNTFDLRDGIQAHLSTCASPKVIEAVNNLKSRIVLYEVPRLSSWPIQFQEHGVRDDNVALFFFAKDLESYDKIYKVLLDNMMKNDLALKGNVNGVELLIYPSNQLPEKSQRWNTLFFLWGVFRGKRENFDSGNQPFPPRDIPPAIMSLPENRCSFRPITEDLPESKNVAPMLEVPASQNLLTLSSSGAVNGDYGAKISSLDDRLNPTSSAAVQNDSAKQCQEIRDTCQERDTLAAKPSSSPKFDSPLDRQQLSNHSSKPAGEKSIDEGIISGNTCSQDEVKLRIDVVDRPNGGTPLDGDRNTRDLNMDPNLWLFNQKERTHPSTSNVVVPTLYAGTSKMNDVPFFSGVLHNRHDEACVETVDFRNAEKRFFPLESQPVDPWKLHGLEHERVPNLELALGAERKSPTKPFLVNDVEHNILDETKTKALDDASACLSLSLSFPFPEKEQSTKPDPKTEQREHVNTSMLLFGSLREN